MVQGGGTPANQRKAIEISNLYKSFNRNQIFTNLNFTIYKNTVNSLVGPNGSGKTTLIRVILKLLNYESGTININGNISTMLENDYLYEELTGNENIRLFSNYFRIADNKVKNVLDKYVECLSIENQLNKKIYQYSKGMKRKFSLLVTLLRDTDILVLDEPTSGVDPSSRIEIRNILSDLKNDGKTIFITSHDLSEIEKMTDVVSILNEGTIVATISKNELNNMNRFSVNINDFDIEDQILDIIKKHSILSYIKDEQIIFISFKNINFFRQVFEKYNLEKIDFDKISLEEVYMQCINE